jgi:bifunctional non-homologous end joining protein LigD
MADEVVEPGTGVAHRALGELRLQEYGGGSPARIADPIVEPLWVGLRALAAVSGPHVAMRDLDGEPVGGFDEIAKALAIAVQSDEIVLEGLITKQATHAARPVVAWSDEMPSLGSFVGLRRNRALEATKLKEEALAAAMFEPDDLIAFVATDLLWLDDTALLDVPLLERRRLLESVLQESDGVRIGTFVRPPIDHWVGSWRAQGFGGLTYKAANSHYLPGRKTPDWTIGGMPRR